MTRVPRSLPWGRAAIRLPENDLPIRNHTQLLSLPASVVSFPPDKQEQLAPASYVLPRCPTSCGPSGTGRGWRLQRHSLGSTQKEGLRDN